MKKLHRSYYKYRFNLGYTFDIETGEAIKTRGHERSEHEFSKACKVFKLDKGNGKFRVIYSPNDFYKKRLKLENMHLIEVMQALDISGIFHAFLPHRNAVTNAKKHILYSYSMKVDLKNFFDHVTEDMVKEYSVSRYCFINGSPKQGLPTSPMVASLALVKPMNKLRAWLNAKYANTQLTVYADDITISFHNRESYEPIKQKVYEIIKEAGLQVNYKKTKLMFGHKHGMRRIICGVGVDHTKVYPTRATKRKIKQSYHKQDNEHITEGIVEWSRCKVPNPKKRAYKRTEYLKNKRKTKKVKEAPIPDTKASEERYVYDAVAYFKRTGKVPKGINIRREVTAEDPYGQTYVVLYNKIKYTIQM